jgi:ATP-dependent HslUV protease ATP-binding subunit HslU
MALKMTREQEMQKVEHRAFEAAEERILDALLPPARTSWDARRRPTVTLATRNFPQKTAEGELDDREIEIELPQALWA